MKSPRKILLKWLVKAGLIDKVGYVKGPLAQARAMELIRPDIKGFKGVIVKKYKGKNICKVQVDLNQEADLEPNNVIYDALIFSFESRKSTTKYTDIVEGGFDEGDIVDILGWDGLSTSVIEVVPQGISQTLTDRHIIVDLLGSKATIVETYPNYFCKIQIDNYLIEAKYQGVHPPIIGENVKITDTISSQVVVKPT